MKKLSKLFLVLAITVFTSIGSVACGVFGTNDENGENSSTAVATGNLSVTFDLNYDGAETNEVEVKAGEKVEKPETPAREGYAFNGWYYNERCTNEFDFSLPIEEYTTVYAGWRKEQATITYDYNYEGAPEEISLTVNTVSAITALEDPARDGYIFGGWFTDRRGRTEFSFTDGIWKDTTVYAYWVSTDARVIYNYNYDGAPANDSVSVTVGEKVEKPADPERAKYSFTGWFTDPSATKSYDFDASVEAGTTILYAGWKLAIAEVTFNYNYEGSENAMQDVNVNTTLTKSTDPTRTGYNFVAWYTDAACTTAYDFSALVTDNMTLYAKWEKQTYTVNFNNNYEDAANAVFTSASVRFEETVTVPESDPVREGYVFIGWYTEADCINQFAATTLITGNTELYAGWMEVEEDTTVTVTFQAADDNTVYSTSEVEIGTKINAPATDPVREDERFGGWYTSADFTTAFVDGTVISTDTVIYAKWLKKYTFEAEYTDLTNKPAQGTSTNGNGPTGLIFNANDFDNVDKIGVSNGYYVSNLFYNGAELVFEIEAAEEVTDAVLQLRLTPEYYTMAFDPSSYKVEVNGVSVNYSSIFLPIVSENGDNYGWPTDGGNVVGGPEMNKKPFENVEITASLHLQKGKNVIKLITTNERDHGATYNAETPAVDCIYIYSAVELKWAEGKCFEENIEGL